MDTLINIHIGVHYFPLGLKEFLESFILYVNLSINLYFIFLSCMEDFTTLASETLIKTASEEFLMSVQDKYTSVFNLKLFLFYVIYKV